jgi:YidC/Oxa1 family membrane protein insertase
VWPHRVFCVCRCFGPSLRRRSTGGVGGRNHLVCRASNIEPFLFHSVTDAGVPSALDHLAASLTNLAVLGDVVAAADPSAVADAAADAPQKSGGFMSIFAGPLESFLKLIDSGLDSAGVPYSYGFSIIVLTLLVKLATYPLSAKQVESTLRMQQLQPRVKELQAKYANDAERLQMETAKLYQTTGVNPLAGCLPTLATIPVFIGLYRALGNVADEGLLTDGFFWIPSLAGPTKLNGGLGWLVPVDGIPPLGWHDTISYLILPILLTASQYASQKIISPPQSQDPAQQQTQAILKFIPLMIGYFSLNVPSGLTLYWFTNNLVTTAQQVYLRQKFAAEPEPASGSPSGTYVAPPKPEKTGPTGKEMNARRSNKVIDVEAEIVDINASEFAEDSSSSSSQPKQGDKFRALKAQEEAKKQGAPSEGATMVNSSAETAAAPASSSKKSKKKGSRKKN